MNLGHRLGETITEEKENTIERMISNWRFQIERRFEYWEFDINETLDGKLIVFHDRELEDGTKIKDQTLEAIRAKYNYIPELNQLFSMFKELNKHTVDGVKLIKPIMVEIKRLSSDAGRNELINSIKGFRATMNSNIAIHCICFKTWRINHFDKSFPTNKIKDHFKFRFHSSRINILNVGSHSRDLFKNEIYKTNEIILGGIIMQEITAKDKTIWGMIKSFFRRWF